MEETKNLNESMNLGAQDTINIQPQPFTPNTMYQDSSITVAPSQVIGNQVVNPPESIVTVGSPASIDSTSTMATAPIPTVQEEVVEKPTDSGKPLVDTINKIPVKGIVVNASQFKTAVDNAIKLCVEDIGKLVTTIINLKFTADEGLRITSTDSAFTYTEILSNVKSEENLNISVNAKQLKQFADKVECDEIGITYRKENSTLIIDADGEFIFTEIMDPNNSGEVLDIVLPNLLNELISTPPLVLASYDDFKKKISSASTLTSTQMLEAAFSGVYVGVNVIGTDTLNMYFDQPIPELSSKKMYLPENLNKYIKEMTFGADVKLHLKEEEGLATHIIIEDKNRLLFGALREDASIYPIEGITAAATKEYPYKFKISSKRFYSALDRCAPFLEDVTDDRVVEVEIQGSLLTVRSTKSTAKVVLPITAVSASIEGISKFRMSVKKILTAIDVDGRDELEIHLNDASVSSVKLLGNGFIQLLSVDQNI